MTNTNQTLHEIDNKLLVLNKLCLELITLTDILEDYKSFKPEELEEQARAYKAFLDLIQDKSKFISHQIKTLKKVIESQANFEALEILENQKEELNKLFLSILDGLYLLDEIKEHLEQQENK